MNGILPNAITAITVTSTNGRSRDGMSLLALHAPEGQKGPLCHPAPDRRAHRADSGLAACSSSCAARCLLGGVPQLAGAIPSSSPLRSTRRCLRGCGWWSATNSRRCFPDRICTPARCWKPSARWLDIIIGAFTPLATLALFHMVK